jgi:hypothetical protein
MRPEQADSLTTVSRWSEDEEGQDLHRALSPMKKVYIVLKHD